MLLFEIVNFSIQTLSSVAIIIYKQTQVAPKL